ncbi:MAG: membrane protein insertase YidC [Bacteroidetes bacterium]|nr:MAG: membrane protein insertase YidC [Bacteroidota bacterium]
MDRNQTIGIVLISLMLVAYMFLVDSTPTTPANKNNTTETKKEIPSTAEEFPHETVLKVGNDTASALLQQKFGVFAYGVKGESQEVVLENKDIKVVFNTLGGSIKQVLLKNYLTHSQEPLILIDEKSSDLTLDVETVKGNVNLRDFYYQAHKIDDQTISFRIQVNEEHYIEQKYTLGKEGFIINYGLNFKGLEEEIKSKHVLLEWTSKLKPFEKNIEQSRVVATVNFFNQTEGLDYLNETSNDPQEIKAEYEVSWVAFKQKFFTSAILNQNTFSNVLVRSKIDPFEPEVEKMLYTSLHIPVKDLQNNAIRFYFGPNDYDITKTVGEGFEKNVYLGWAIFSVVNKYVIMPLFQFLESMTNNYGMVIFLLVLIIKIALFPLVYNSFKSMAKTKILQPELNKIKEQFPDDATKVQQEQMKLYSLAGVNPLSGCIPFLLQMPILLAMFNFFPNIIQLRQKSFLWAEDLSTYDSIITFGFQIPFYGDHVSLFTILMTISTILYTYYMSQMQAAQNPQMQMLSYAMPVVFMFVLNSFSAGLTYYYFVSNFITIGQQAFIKRFVDENAIRKMMDDNKIKNANKPKSSFQTRIEEAMKEKNKKKE